MRLPRRLLALARPALLLPALLATGCAVDGVANDWAFVVRGARAPELAEWWQWHQSIPAEQHPDYDLAGVECETGQMGDLFHLAWAFEPTERMCTVPASKRIIAPVASALVYSDDPTFDPENPDDLFALEERAARLVEGEACDIQVFANGMEMTNPWRMFEVSPAFGFELEQESTLGHAPGVYDPVHAAGVFVSLDLTPGSHFLSITVDNCEDGFEGTTQDYRLTILPE